jgi:formyltetrahydrofolate hydrolase
MYDVIFDSKYCLKSLLLKAKRRSLDVDIVHIILSDNLHYASLKPFGVTEDSAGLADVYFAVLPHFSSLCS